MLSQTRLMEILGNAGLNKTPEVNTSQPDKINYILNTIKQNKSTEEISQDTSMDLSKQVGVEYKIKELDASKGIGYNVGALAENTLKSGGQYLKDTMGVFIHPIKTAKNLGNLALGVIDGISELAGWDLFTGEQDKTQYVKAVWTYFKNRYGSVDNAAKTITYDPVGFLSDLSTVLSGGSAIAGKVSKTSKVSKVADTAWDISKALKLTSSAVDPLEITARTIGGAVSKIKSAKLKVDDISEAIPLQEKIFKETQADIMHMPESQIETMINNGYLPKNPFKESPKTYKKRIATELDDVTKQLWELKNSPEFKSSKIAKTDITSKFQEIKTKGAPIIDTTTGEVIGRTKPLVKVITKDGIPTEVPLGGVASGTINAINKEIDNITSLGKQSISDLLDMKTRLNNSAYTGKWVLKDTAIADAARYMSNAINDVIREKYPEIAGKIEPLNAKVSTLTNLNNFIDKASKINTAKYTAWGKIKNVLPFALTGGIAWGGIKGLATVAVTIPIAYKVIGWIDNPVTQLWLKSPESLKKFNQMASNPNKLVKFLNTVVSNPQYQNSAASLDRLLDNIEDTTE